MQILEHGQEHQRTLLFFPCTAEPVWAFTDAIALLARKWHIFQVVYDGHQPGYPGDFTSVEQTVDEAAEYLKNHGAARLDAAYGCSLGGACLTRLLALGEISVDRAIIDGGITPYSCSLGGSFVGLLAARQNIHMDYGILGSSDLDQASKFTAKLQTNLLLPMIYPLIRDGQFKSRFLQNRLEKRMAEMGDYVRAFMKIFGGARSYVTEQSCKNQFYSDLVTPLPDKIDAPGTELHIFCAPKMGEKYRARYQQHFARPVIHEQNLQHEELLACCPEQWAELVKSIVKQGG